MDTNTWDAQAGARYAAEAKARWGDTPAYRAYEQNAAGRSARELRAAGEGLMETLAVFGGLKRLPAADPSVQAQVQALKDYISAHFYPCTNEVLAGLGGLYAAGGEYTAAIDAAGGDGTAAFAAEAIRRYCEGKDAQGAIRNGC